MLEDVRSEASGCTRCRLATGRTQVVFGVGDPDADLMFVGEAPGFHEDQQGIPFVGQAGKLLDTLLGGIGLTRAQVYIANILKCRPPGNRDPEGDEIESCTPWLVEQISLIQPRLLVTLGNFATKFVLQTRQGITRTRGQVYAWHGRSVIPTFHPAAILHNGGERSRQFRDMQEDFELVRRTLGPEASNPDPSRAAPTHSTPSAAEPAAPAPRAATEPARPAPSPPAPRAAPPAPVPGLAARADGPLVVPAPSDEEQLELF
jgi:uracil-DNA glycosylase family 4